MAVRYSVHVCVCVCGLADTVINGKMVDPLSKLNFRKIIYVQFVWRRLTILKCEATSASRVARVLMGLKRTLFFSYSDMHTRRSRSKFLEGTIRYTDGGISRKKVKELRT